MDTSRILDLIKNAVANETTIHALDEKRVTRIFYNEIITNGWYGLDEVQEVINKLHNHSKYNKERIQTIAGVIQMLKDQS